jgi:multiple antibiotic resistance protein
MEWLASLGSAVLALFAILNPIGLIPAYAELTEGLDPRTVKKLYRITTLVGYATLMVMSLTGQWIMRNVFRISMGEFKIAGGLVLTALAVKSLVIPAPKRDHQRPENVLEAGVVPMAIPLLVGPGSIVTAILMMEKDGAPLTIGAITAVFCVVWFILWLSRPIERVVGHFGVLVVGRIMWIFIASIGVHFLSTGIQQVFGIGGAQ